MIEEQQAIREAALDPALIRGRIQFVKEPAAGEFQVALGRCQRDREHFGGFFHGEREEETQFNQMCLALVELFEPVEGAAQVENLFRGSADPGDFVRQGKPDRPWASPSLGNMRAGVILEDVAHHASGKGEEMAAVVPGDLSLVEQAHVDFVDQRGRLQGVVFALVAHVALGYAMQLCVDQWDKAFQDFRITISPALQHQRYFTVRIFHRAPLRTTTGASSTNTTCNMRFAAHLRTDLRTKGES